MSTYTYKLKGARWLRMWTAADRSSVYAAQSEAQKIADTLCDVPWTRAKSDGPAMFPLTAAKSLDENPANRDLFDAALFCAEHSDGAHRAYANAAMYLFKLPSTSGVNLKSVTVHVESDAYNALGARIAVHLLSSAELPTDCATVRTGAAHAEGVAPRTTAERDGRNYWYSYRDDKTITGGTTESPSAIGELTQYLAVFVGMENYATSRNEWLEGASYIRNLIEIETDAVVTGWTDGGTYDCSDAGPAVLLSGGSSPTWLQPLPTVNVGSDAPPIPQTDSEETFYSRLVETESAETSFLSFVPPLTASGYGGGTVKISYAGETVTSVTWTGTGNDHFYQRNTGEWWIRQWRPTGGVNYNEFAMELSIWFERQGDPEYSRIKWEGTYTVGSESKDFASDDSSDDNVRKVFDLDAYYIMLTIASGAPIDADLCSLPNLDSRRHKSCSIEPNSASAWTVTIDGAAYSVTLSDGTVTLADGTELLGEWVSAYLNASSFFDPAASLHLGDVTVGKYGLAAALGDFSHAVATFEAGTQPSDTEVLGRLARMSRKEAGAMFYLHPENGALANELDVLRPVPRFWRTATDPSGQTDCQPGLSVWYKRATTSSGGSTVTGSSSAATGIVQRERPTPETVVTGPAFLQLTVLALRAQSAFSSRLVLANKVGASDANAVINHFKLRFVAWRSPAEQWDGSNAFAMAAMASMPSIYRSDGDGNVAWNVDCTGNLLRFGMRAMMAERIGVSQIVSGEIGAGASVGIPLAAPVAEGDVVLIAPEVLGFANGTGDLSQYFGRQANPATATDAGKGWARYTHNLGWFPKVTGE